MQGFASTLADTQARAKERPSALQTHTQVRAAITEGAFMRSQHHKGSSWERCWRAVRDMRMMDYLMHKIVLTRWHKVQVVYHVC